MYNRHSMSSEDFDNLPFRNRQQRYVSSKRNPTRFDRNERLREIFQNIFSLYDDHDEYHRYKQRSSLKSFADNSQKNVCQACQVVVTYRKDSKSRSTKTDEIVIKQKIDEYDRSIIIYKGYLQKNETFSFKSRHVREYPFDIKLYVNGYLEIHFKDCCEYKFCQGDIRLGHSFTIERIDKTIPCHKCRRQIQREEKKKKNQMEVKKMWLNEEKHEIVDERINSQSEDETSNHNQNSTTLDEQETQQQKSKENSPDEPSQTEIDNNGNNSGFLQALLSFLRNGVAQVEIQETIAARYEGNVEDFVVIVFGFDIEMTQLYSIANFCKVFNEIKEMNSFIETLQVERILLVTNKDLSNESSKFSSIYRETSFNEDLLKKIRRENPIDNELISIEFSSSNQSFIYSQLLKETLLRKDEDANLKKDYFDYCRLHYKDNFNEMKLIDQLEKEFSEENLHFWFKKDSFCRKMLNRACRTNEIDILYKIRWILQGLNRQSPLSKPVYQLKYLTSNQLEQFQTSSKDFLSFANFLLCQFTKPSTLEFRSNYETVLFTIRSQNGIDFGESSNEVLLPFDNVYQIESIEQISSDENIYWNIHLISIDKEENNEFQKLIKEMKTQIESPATLIQFGKLLLANGDYLHADYFARFLFNDNSLKDNPTLLAGLAAIHHLLGSVDNRKNNHRAARLQFQQSLQVFLTFIPDDHPMLSATYNNIGSMFYQDDEHEQAIIYHQKALQCQLKSPSPDIEAIATYSGNIGAVYLDEKKYDQALINYKRSLQLLLQSTPSGESLSIAMIYDRLACIYWRMEQPENALPFYQKSLQLELKYLPDDNHKISVSYFNLSTAYAKLNRLDEAINCAEKSIEQLLKSVPIDHPEVKENTEQLEALRRKKWLQTLYS
ncbi:unnamed protein product [Adineta ricciae]|uniref:DUF4590 domain-containing protein n=1 Tax=Adineta ricciae TaxID=249248 RepID=A0A814DM11_ADIRI|nr:unnamed protein product [Adineta ricciae]